VNVLSQNKGEGYSQSKCYIIIDQICKIHTVYMRQSTIGYPIFLLTDFRKRIWRFRWNYLFINYLF